MPRTSRLVPVKQSEYARPPGAIAYRVPSPSVIELSDDEEEPQQERKQPAEAQRPIVLDLTNEEDEPQHPQQQEMVQHVQALEQLNERHQEIREDRRRANTNMVHLPLFQRIESELSDATETAEIQKAAHIISERIMRKMSAEARQTHKATLQAAHTALEQAYAMADQKTREEYGDVIEGPPKYFDNRDTTNEQFANRRAAEELLPRRYRDVLDSQRKIMTKAELAQQEYYETNVWPAEAAADEEYTQSRNTVELYNMGAYGERPSAPIAIPDRPVPERMWRDIQAVPVAPPAAFAAPRKRSMVNKHRTIIKTTYDDDENTPSLADIVAMQQQRR